MTKKCDCLNMCGDDPDIKKGKVSPCQQFIDAKNRGMINIEIDRNINELGIEFIQYIESEIDRAMQNCGFARTQSTKSENLGLKYRQFAVCK